MNISFYGLTLLRQFHKTLLFLLFLCTNVCYAQQTAFAPEPQNDAALKSLSASLEKQYQSDIAALPAENKKDLIKLYKERWDNISSKIEKKEVFENAAAQQFLDNMLKNIIASNPALKAKNISCYFSRSGVPNAAYLGEGLILFNMGLFSRLQNESEVAFVLCHELAHLYLNHSENSISKYVSTLNSPEIQQQLKNIKKQEYGKRIELEKLIKGISFDSRRHGRDHESNADSFAVELMSHTKYDPKAAISALSLLDVIDKDTLNMANQLHRFFDSPSYPFQKKWLLKEEGLLSGHAQLTVDKTLEDSLKTHPDCEKRIRLIEPLVNTLKTNVKAEDGSSQQFMQLQNDFKYEIIEYAFESGNYTQSLKYTMDLMATRPGDVYLVSQTGKIFNGFYTSQKEHTLGKKCDLPAPYYAPSYNLLLQFIQNLYVEDFAGIGYNFLNQYASQFNNNAGFKKVFNESARIKKEEKL
ncbi:MAG: M48 family metallopeptidase [Ginsengibacter sp.]